MSRAYKTKENCRNCRFYEKRAKHHGYCHELEDITSPFAWCPKHEREEGD